jgi:hypothetical protein
MGAAALGAGTGHCGTACKAVALRTCLAVEDGLACVFQYFLIIHGNTPLVKIIEVYHSFRKKQIPSFEEILSGTWEKLRKMIDAGDIL